MVSLKDKVINAGLSILISGTLIVLGADMARMVRQDRRSSLRERVYELVQQKYQGNYYTKIEGEDLHVGTLGYNLLQSNETNRSLYVEVRSEKGEFYFQDQAKTGSAEDSFLGRLDYWEGKVKSPEKEFDDYLRLVKKEIGKP